MAPTSAVVEQILVEPGKKVEAGQFLLMLDASLLRTDVAKAEAAVATARGNLVEAQAGAPEVSRAEAQADVERLQQELEHQKRLASLPPMTTPYEQAGIILENAKARLERMQALFAKRLVSKPEVEAAENEYAEAWGRFEAAKELLGQRDTVGDGEVRIAEARYRAARARLAALEKAGPNRGRVKAAQGQIRQVEADLDRARYNLRQTTLEAPISGIVTEVMVQLGEKVHEGKPVVRIADIAKVNIKADLSPGLLPYVHIGQKAKVTVNTVWGSFFAFSSLQGPFRNFLERARPVKRKPCSSAYEKPSSWGGNLWIGLARRSPVGGSKRSRAGCGRSFRSKVCTPSKSRRISRREGSGPNTSWRSLSPTYTSPRSGPLPPSSLAGSSPFSGSSSAWSIPKRRMPRE